MFHQGNIMIDTLEANRDKSAQLEVNNIIADNLLEDQLEARSLKLEADGSYAVLTINKAVIAREMKCNVVFRSNLLNNPPTPPTKNQLRTMNRLLRSILPLAMTFSTELSLRGR